MSHATTHLGEIKMSLIQRFTDNVDVIQGLENSYTVRLLDGNDIFRSHSTFKGTDLIYAGAGNDSVWSGFGNDRVFGG
ncbi:MAG: Ca2+-binding RTX toxin-like protein, partial [Yoonia sp.]